VRSRWRPAPRRHGVRCNALLFAASKGP